MEPKRVETEGYGAANHVPLNWHPIAQQTLVMSSGSFGEAIGEFWLRLVYILVNYQCL